MEEPLRKGYWQKNLGQIVTLNYDFHIGESYSEKDLRENLKSSSSIFRGESYLKRGN
jgi:hypothetical protein